MNNRILALAATLLLSACGKSPLMPETSADGNQGSAALASVLASQPEETQARYAFRHPLETLEFIGIKPEMTVVEALPGGGWYSKILLDYLGPQGRLIGADYPMAMWPMFGIFPAEFIADKKNWVADWTEEASGWRSNNSASVTAFVFGSMPASIEASADAVVFIRALHNLHRFEDEGGFFTQALADAHRALKPGGVVGIVQHRAPASMPDDWATGARGYLKQDALIARVESAGFDFVAASEINANPNDKPGADDVVWRLPPSLATSRDDPELRAKMLSVGESDRMTLKFTKR